MAFHSSAENVDIETTAPLSDSSSDSVAVCRRDARGFALTTGTFERLGRWKLTCKVPAPCCFNESKLNFSC